MSTINLVDHRGDSLTFNITLKTTAGVAIDITGWTFYFTVKEKLEDLDADAVLQIIQTSHTDPTGGQTTMSVTPAETNVLLGSYCFDLQYKTDSGAVETYMDGTLTFTEEATRTGS